MPDPTFSITERIIIDPVLYLRADLLNDPDAPPGICRKIWHFIEGEIIARIMAISTSLFATADFFTHFFTGLYKGSNLVLSKFFKISPSWNGSDVCAHFKAAALFGGISVIGSVAGTVWPGVFKYFRQSVGDAPNDPPDLDAEGEVKGAPAKDTDSQVPQTIRDLVNAVQTQQERPPFRRLQAFWEQCRLSNDLSSRRWFVHAFNRNDSICIAVRKALTNRVYTPIAQPSSGPRDIPWLPRNIQWLNEIEVAVSISSGSDEVASRVATLCKKAFFFHATSREALESILKSRRVEVRHEKAFQGAFVSTRPELAFGRCVLAFRRNIDRLSPLQHGFRAGENTYWAGFSRDIPVTENTLAYIMLDGDNEREREHLQDLTREWTGRTIQVVLRRHAEAFQQQVQKLDLGIPSEWPDEGARAGQAILKAMRIAIAIPQHAAVEQKQRIAVAAPHRGARLEQQQQHQYSLAAGPGEADEPRYAQPAGRRLAVAF